MPLASTSFLFPLMAGRNKVWVGIYFSLLLLIGFLVHKDYGVSWDESIDRTNGIVNAKYIASHLAPGWASRQPVFANVPDFYTYSENDHGALFHLPLAFWEISQGGVDSRIYYHARHFCIFLTFVIGVWALYGLGRMRFQHWQLGMIASTLLVLSPRFFADAFYNGKDLVFAAFFTLGIYTLVRLLKRPSLWRALLHGLATAVATDIRIMGCLLMAFSLGMLVLEALLASPNKSRYSLLTIGLVYSVATIIATVLGWPYLWEQPFESFLQAFDNMRQFRWEGLVIYLGEPVSSLQLPWHYVPVWIIVTTPVAYTLAFLLGFTSYCYTSIRQGLGYLRTFEGRLDLLFTGWFFLPILMVVVLNSVIYDGWRHLYFIYPALLLLAIRGGNVLWQAGQQRQISYRLVLAITALAATEALFTLVRMVTAHPNQQVFFSFLPAATAERLFERDYWGLSYRQGLEWILAHDSSPTLPISAFDPIVLENGMATMRYDTRNRFQIKPLGSSGYFLSAYRYHPGHNPETMGKEVYVVRANGLKILSVYQKK
jgi:hypothetical protein